MLQTSAAFASKARPRAVAIWLLVVAAMIVGIVVIGGITRLTGSGLSITEWKPLTGAIPPLTIAQWQAEFANYQRIPQYQQFNRGMTLGGFQAIFFWEYLHRFLGRFIGMAFLLPAIWLAARRRVPAGYAPRLVALFALILLQGTLGWLMVRSGLSVRTSVAPGWLAAHLVTAMVTLAGMVWTALDLIDRARNPYATPARLTRVGAVALLLLLVQICWGAFTAGLHAGYAFASWPLMGDTLFPAGVPMLSPAISNARRQPDRGAVHPSLVRVRRRCRPDVAGGARHGGSIARRVRGDRAGHAADHPGHRDADVGRADRDCGRASGECRTAADRHRHRRPGGRNSPGMMLPVSKAALCLTI